MGRSAAKGASSPKWRRIQRRARPEGQPTPILKSSARKQGEAPPAPRIPAEEQRGRYPSGSTRRSTTRRDLDAQSDGRRNGRDAAPLIMIIARTARHPRSQAPLLRRGAELSCPFQRGKSRTASFGRGCHQRLSASDHAALAGRSSAFRRSQAIRGLYKIRRGPL